MKENDFVLNDLENVAPSPIAPRKCKCKCGHLFQPTSTNKVFINKQHADHYHYHEVKKPKRKIQNEIEKIHRANDRICAKYVNSSEHESAICSWESFISDGYNEQYNQGTKEENERIYIFTYNYYYFLFNEDGLKKIKISKR